MSRRSRREGPRRLPPGLGREPLLALLACAVLGLAAPVPEAGGSTPGPAASPAVDLVRLPFPQDDGSLTPYTFERGYALMTLVYDTLLWRGEDGTPQPLLARAVDTSADGRTVTIRLAPGARWHDGVPVTADDVVFTFGFVAAHPHPRFTPEVAAVERAEAPDPATVVLTLHHPSQGFADQPLADLPILPAHLWRDLPPGRLAPEGLPVGSGPYRLVEHQPGVRYRFAADAEWFGGPPPVRAIEVPIITGGGQTFDALGSHMVDMIPLSLPNSLDQRQRLRGTRVVRGTSYLGTALILNTRRPPFDRVDVRRAVAGSMDLVSLARFVKDVVPADRGFVHPASPWAPEGAVGTPSVADVEATLAGAGLARLEILAPANDQVKLEAARQVALALARAGVQATTRPVSRDELSVALGEKGGDPTFDAVIGAIPPLASYDPDFLRPLFGSGAGPAAALNISGYTSARFDRLAETVAGTADPGTRSAAVADELRLLADDAPAVPLFFAEGAYVFRPSVFAGWVFVKGSGILDKRSFVAPHPTEVQPGAATGSTSGSADYPLGRAALVLVGVAAAMLVVALALRR
ncbi:MAG TPA: ABC transporter substrate-binding protein [Acidimicrobiales bacterium]|nr:ABC transporter substrate-binding protein [Acidimicrobiales bacterium]